MSPIRSESNRAEAITNPAPERARYELALTVHSDFLQDCLEVVTYRVGRQEQLLGDLPIGESLQNQRRQLALASSEPAGLHQEVPSLSPRTRQGDRNSSAERRSTVERRSGDRHPLARQTAQRGQY